ncbi:site-specific integrase [Sutcliffiella cohnii]|uniref:site-specific integrase n=1 Tax=Sutcliffiella cohnii TaxID=33932 RepID=UPI002E219389|nr:site-specific integrase [Sutcliffiella cohnii]MED4018702.1 site-specific integrase [Sutcliffiella cohnii]
MDFQQALDEFLLYLQVEQNYSTNTVDSYESDLTKFIAFLQQHNRSTALQDITPSLVRRFIQQETLPSNHPTAYIELTIVLPLLSQRKLHLF